VEELDGTKRLVISNRAQFPGDFYKGHEDPRRDRSSSAGLLRSKFRLLGRTIEYAASPLVHS